MTTSATPLNLYQLRVVLRGINPLIWRQVLVRSDTTLAHLHTILQILFTWSNEHLVVYLRPAAKYHRLTR